MNFFTAFVTAFKTNRTGAIVGVLILANVFLAAKWISAEAALRQCYRDTVEQERKHSEEKEKIREEQNKQWYTIGELKAQIKYSKK